MPEAYASVLIDAADPCLDGHFPGNPLIPGVIALERVMEAVRQRRGSDAELAALPLAKFTSPWHPGERLDIELEELDSNRLQFRCSSDNRQVATGIVELRSPRPAGP